MAHNSTSRFPAKHVAAPAALLAAALLLGGFPIATDWRFLVILLVGTICLGRAVLEKPDDTWARLPWPVVAFALLCLALPALQLIPLPPSWWQAMPGRGLENDIRIMAGAGNRALPMTLSPATNLQLAAVLPVLFGFAVVVARLDASRRHFMICVALAIAVVQFILGSIQFASDGAMLAMPGDSDRGWLIGTFANRNHAALFFACSVLLATGFAARGSGLRPSSRGSGQQRLHLIVGCGLAAALVAGVLGTGSRSGVGLSALALVIGVFLLAPARTAAKWAVGGAVAVAVAGATMAYSIQRVEKLARRYDTVSDDLRWEFWTNTWPLIESYAPWGAGFGSFSGVYAKTETIARLTPNYVNNAHNDYLELFLEAGLPGAIALALAFALVIWLTIRGLRHCTGIDRTHVIVGSGIILLIALHSMVDYPLRRLGMATMLFLGFGLLLSQFTVSRRSGSLPS